MLIILYCQAISIAIWYANELAQWYRNPDLNRMSGSIHEAKFAQAYKIRTWTKCVRICPYLFRDITKEPQLISKFCTAGSSFNEQQQNKTRSDRLVVNQKLSVWQTTISKLVLFDNLCSLLPGKWTMVKLLSKSNFEKN